MIQETINSQKNQKSQKINEAQMEFNPYIELSVPQSQIEKNNRNVKYLQKVKSQNF